MEQTSNYNVTQGSVTQGSVNYLSSGIVYRNCMIVSQFNEDSHTHPPFHCGQSLLHKQHTPSLQCQCCGQEAELAVDNRMCLN